MVVTVVDFSHVSFTQSPMQFHLSSLCDDSTAEHRHSADGIRQVVEDAGLLRRLMGRCPDVLALYVTTDDEVTRAWRCRGRIREHGGNQIISKR